METYRTRYPHPYRVQYRARHCIRYRIRYVIYVFNQEGFVSPLDIDAADVLTGSEHILKACASKHNPTAAAINDIIKDFDITGAGMFGMLGHSYFSSALCAPQVRWDFPADIRSIRWFILAHLNP